MQNRGTHSALRARAAPPHSEREERPRLGGARAAAAAAAAAPTDREEDSPPRAWQSASSSLSESHLRPRAVRNEEVDRRDLATRGRCSPLLLLSAAPRRTDPRPRDRARWHSPLLRAEHTPSPEWQSRCLRRRRRVLRTLEGEEGPARASRSPLLQDRGRCSSSARRARMMRPPEATGECSHLLLGASSIAPAPSRPVPTKRPPLAAAAAADRRTDYDSLPGASNLPSRSKLAAAASSAGGGSRRLLLLLLPPPISLGTPSEPRPPALSPHRTRPNHPPPSSSPQPPPPGRPKYCRVLRARTSPSSSPGPKTHRSRRHPPPPPISPGAPGGSRPPALSPTRRPNRTPSPFFGECRSSSSRPPPLSSMSMHHRPPPRGGSR
mmetsp:Transcript_16957/g.49023  ORF Transcript_16957/g.49023 Transcript_16957/m.49023 type:complete len:380 (-) Transcript_16957:18-1157(-)